MHVQGFTGCVGYRVRGVTRVGGMPGTKKPTGRVGVRPVGLFFGLCYLVLVLGPPEHGEAAEAQQREAGGFGEGGGVGVDVVRNE